MRSALVSVAAIAALVACEKKQDPNRFAGDGFSMPIPSGYRAAGPEMIAELDKTDQKVDAALFADKVGERFRPSIVVTRVATADVDAASGKACEEIAAPAREIGGVKIITPPERVEYPFGKTCQLEMGDAKQHAIQTIAYVGDTYWTITCNMDPHERDARGKDCQEVLRGFGK
jgi:hypothetical protein